MSLLIGKNAPWWTCRSSVSREAIGGQRSWGSNRRDFPRTPEGSVSATPQMAATDVSRPQALTSRSISSGSPVRIMAFWRRAVVTTNALTTSAVLVMPSSFPAWCASLSPGETTTHPVKKRRSWACFGDRLIWATTGEGTDGITPISKRALCSAHARCCAWFAPGGETGKGANQRSPLRYTINLVKNGDQHSTTLSVCGIAPAQW